MKRGLSESTACPSFADLTEFEEPSMDYYDGWEVGCLTPALNWVYLSEIVLPNYHPLRPSALTKDCRGEQHPIVFYIDNGVPFNPNFVPGHTIALLYAERKTFMDMTVGIRFEEPDSVKIFKCSLADLQSESKKLNANHCYGCHVENAKFLRCGKCKIAMYCDKECQLKHWGLHKWLCSDMKVLEKLVNLIHSPFRDFVSFKQLSL